MLNLRHKDKWSLAMKLDTKSLSQTDFEEMARNEIISLCSALMTELEKTRGELRESVRTEIDLRFALNEGKIFNKNTEKDG